MKPMLAHTFEAHRYAGGPLWLQPKFNGVRALYQDGYFQSREELPWPKDFLKHLAEPLKEMFDERTILDGELYRHGWKLQRINQAVAVNATVRGATEDTLEIDYYVFDQVKFNSPFFIRFNEVSRVITQLQHTKIFAATTVRPPDRQWIEKFYAETVSDGFEGIMYRIGLCPYTKPKQPKENNPGFLSDKNNRTWHLLKRKGWQDGEFTCLRVLEGEGKRAGMVGSFECSIHDQSEIVFYVGSGLTDAEATRYFHNPPIGRKIKVKFLTYTEDGIPFNPTVEAIL